MDNKYWWNICAIAEKQRAKGIATYGTGIEDNPADIITRIEYLEEDPANEENVTRIKNYLAVNGAKV